MEYTLDDLCGFLFSDVTDMSASSEPRRLRWFHVTPDRVLLVLPFVWGVLWLFQYSDRLSTRYSVLLAATSMLAVVLVLLAWFTVALLFRCRFQYSVRTLLLLMLSACIGMSWVA
jgi:hypothetical protein